MNWLSEMENSYKRIQAEILIFEKTGQGNQVMECKAQLLILKRKIELHKEKIKETQILKTLLTNEKARLLDRELRGLKNKI